MAGERRYFVVESEFAVAPGSEHPHLNGTLATKTAAGPRFKSLDRTRTVHPDETGRIGASVEMMTEAQAADRRRDDRVRVVGEPLPLALIEGRASSSTNDDGDCSGDAWGIEACGAEKSRFDGSGVNVAVIDTGLDLAHPAFASVKDKIDVRDFTDSPTGGEDRRGHGTHCAGTLFGQDVDGRRIGVARGFERAFIAKVFADDGSSDATALFDAMIWAQRSGAHVISMSLGFDVPGMIERLMDWYDLPPKIAASQAIVSFATNLRAFDTLVASMEAQAAFGEGALVFAASGNESERQTDRGHVVSASLPGSAKGVIPIGAFYKGREGYDVADFSNADPFCVAPGVGIVSAKAGGKGLEAQDGTSMACPHAAGVASLWWQYVRENEGVATPPRVSELMLGATVRDGFREPYDAADLGRGRVTAPS